MHFYRSNGIIDRLIDTYLTEDFKTFLAVKLFIPNVDVHARITRLMSTIDRADLQL